MEEKVIYKEQLVKAVLAVRSLNDHEISRALISNILDEIADIIKRREVKN